MNRFSIERLGLAAVVATAVAGVLAGCGDDNRVPTKNEVQAADVKRQSYIDSLNIPESQKAIMKSHMGGPPAQNPAAAAAASQAPKDRR